MGSRCLKVTQEPFHVCTLPPEHSCAQQKLCQCLGVRLPSIDWAEEVEGRWPLTFSLDVSLEHARAVGESRRAVAGVGLWSPETV